MWKCGSQPKVSNPCSHSGKQAAPPEVLGKGCPLQFGEKSSLLNTVMYYRSLQSLLLPSPYGDINKKPKWISKNDIAVNYPPRQNLSNGKSKKKKHAQMFNWGLCYKHVKSMGSLSTCYIGEGSLRNTAVQLKTQTQRDNQGINQTLPSDLPPSTNNWCFQDTTKFLSFLWVRATGTDLIITCTHIQKKKEGMTKLVPHSISNFCLSSL